MLSLRSSLIVIFVLLGVAPLGLFWLWPQSSALQKEFDDVKDRHLVIARNLAHGLQRFHRDATSTFDFAADTLLAGAALPDTRSVLANLRFRSICQVEVATGRLLRGVRGLGQCQEQLAAATQEMLGTMKEGGRTVLSPVHADANGEPVIAWMRRSGKVAVVGTIDTRYFVESGRSIAFGRNGHTTIVDQTGRVLAHPITEWESEMHDLSQLEVVRELLDGRAGIKTYYSHTFKDEVIAAYVTVEGAGWGIMISQPLAELKDAINRFQRSALSIFAMCLLLAALVACRAAFTLLDPVARVIDGASAMARGSTDVRLPLPGRLAPRELTDLTSTFNALAENVASARRGEARAREAAERANQSKTDFLRTVTHELRSPLNAIVGFSDLLATGKLGPPGSAASQACLEDIRTGARMMMSLTNDLLDLARIEANQYPIDDELLDLAEIGGRAARFSQPMAKTRGAEVVVEIDRDLPAVRGDERALFQCVLNLVSNAVKYGRDGGRVVVSADLLQTGGVRISVTDDGPGIAAEDIDRVQQPFERVSNRANRDVTGTGLGLPIVRKLVELHGGRFALQSQLGAGTTAIIELPASRVVSETASILDAAE